MATSGSFDFSLNRNELIDTALRTLNVISVGETPDDDVYTHAARKLNMMLKAWQADGLHLWHKKRVSVFLRKDQSVYRLENASTGDRFTFDWMLPQAGTVKEGVSFTTQAGATQTMGRTEINNSSGEVAGETSLTVDSTTNMTASDNIMIELDNGVAHWTTISSVTDSTTVVIASAIPTDRTGNDDAEVYWYTAQAERPLRILPEHAWVTTPADGTERPVRVISSEEFWRLSNKTSDGAIAEIYYDPQLSPGNLYVFPQSDSSTEVLNFIAEYPVEDMDSDTDDFDIDHEWFLAVELGLAVLLSIQNGITGRQYEELLGQALVEKQRVMGFDHENTSVFIHPAEEWTSEGGMGFRGSYGR